MEALLTHFVIATGLLIGTTTDFKRREVPDWLNFGLIGLGLGLALLWSALDGSWRPIAGSAAGLLVGVIIGYVMYYAGQWGGGDAKLIMGLGALFGIAIEPLSANRLPLFALFIINTVLVGAAYGLLWALVVALRNHRRLRRELKEKLRERRITRYRIVVLATTALLIALAFLAQSPLLTITLAILAFTLFFIFYLWLITKAVERTCMIKQRPTAKLTEGDWVAEEVWSPEHYRPFTEHLAREAQRRHQESLTYDSLLGLYRQAGLSSLQRRREKRLETAAKRWEQKRLSEVARRFSLQTKKVLGGAEHLLSAAEKKHPGLLEHLKNHHGYEPRRRRVAGPQDLGITREQIEELRRKGVKSVTIKEGIPFVPSFLLAYAVTMILGHWYVLLL